MNPTPESLQDAPRIVRCVSGDIRPDELGVTMHHEHLFLDLTWGPDRAMPATKRAAYYEPFALSNRHHIERHHDIQDDRLLLDVPTAIAESVLYRDLGGQAIVDATPLGLGRDPGALLEVAEATGLNIVMGAGYYVDNFHPKDVADASVEQLAERMAADILVGDESGIRAGFLGEIGMSFPVAASELKVLSAAARAQVATGAALMVHPGRNAASPGEHLDHIAAEGGDIQRVIMAHTDRTLFTNEERQALAARGCYIGFDLFGQETSYNPMARVDMPNDATRIDAVRDLFDAGFGAQVLIAQDTCYKAQLEAYGGPGYGHILKNVVPMMRLRGFTSDELHQLLVTNPAEAFGFVPPVGRN